MPCPSRRATVIAVREKRKNEVGVCGLYFMLKIRRVKESLTEGKKREGRKISQLIKEIYVSDSR